MCIIFMLITLISSRQWFGGEIPDRVWKFKRPKWNRNTLLRHSGSIDRGQIYGRIKIRYWRIWRNLIFIFWRNASKPKLLRRGELTKAHYPILKINAKLDGTSHKLVSSPILTENETTLFIGGDVTHPSPDQKTISRFVQLLITYFGARLRGVSKNRTLKSFKISKIYWLNCLKIFEMKMIVSFLIKYTIFTIGTAFPKVNSIKWWQSRETQCCKHVKKFHLVMKSVCKWRFWSFKSDITYGSSRAKLVSEKMRMNNNVPAGTIVDTVITRPNGNSFILNSHQSIQGVGRSTNYCILLDDGNHSIHCLQAITNNVIGWYYDEIC